MDILEPRAIFAASTLYIMCRDYPSCDCCKLCAKCKAVIRVNDLRWNHSENVCIPCSLTTDECKGCKRSLPLTAFADPRDVHTSPICKECAPSFRSETKRASAKLEIDRQIAQEKEFEEACRWNAKHPGQVQLRMDGRHMYFYPNKT